MTTHRSLNKLEFKAHMSIHNFVEVTGESEKRSHFTRDRFGKQHNLTTESGEPLVKRFSRVTLVATFLLMVTVFAYAEDPNSPPPQAKSVNTRIESEENEVFKAEKRENNEGVIFYSDETKKVGINKDGDPALSMPW